MKKSIAAGAAVATAMLLAAGSAQAQCVTKAANATAGSAESAKWFVLETMVQAVSWGLWPSYVANGTVPGYKITNQKYNCKPEGGSVFCRGSATFCKVG